MHTGNQRVERAAIQFANFILVAAGLVCVAALSKVFYHYQWICDRQFAGPVGRSLYYGLPALLAVLFFASLRLRDDRKIKVAIVSTALASWLVVAEIFFESLQYMADNWPFEITEETGPKRANIAERQGVSFDRRTRLQVIADLREQGVDAVPASNPPIFHSKNIDGTSTWNVTWAGHQLYPLGGIAKKTTVFCNENGTYTIYNSDEHGFHNPSGIWSRRPIDVVAIGDSFTHGACVPSDRNFVALIRKSHPGTLNLGVWANGPLSELATLIEYVPALRPKFILWFYFEGNDVTDIAEEKTNTVLMQYLQNDFSQHLVSRQSEIDLKIKEILYRLAAEAAVSERGPAMKLVDSLMNIGTLAAIRQKLGLIYGKSSQSQTESPSALDPELQALFRRILFRAKNIVDRWHGTLYFVYLPDWARYAHPERAVKNRAAVLQMVRSLGIPIIDLSPVFQIRRDPLSLFPFRGFGHYNEAGHALVAETILASIVPPSPAISDSVD